MLLNKISSVDILRIDITLNTNSKSMTLFISQDDQIFTFEFYSDNPQIVFSYVDCLKIIQEEIKKVSVF